MESVSETVLVDMVYFIGELEALQILFPHHPERHHFRYGKPRPYKFIVKQKGKIMSATQPATTYLSTATTTFNVSAVDQYGFPYIGADLANTTVTSDTPANVTATLGAFDPTTGVAVLTLTQAGGEGSANVTVTDGSVNYEFPVVSYVPALTGFTVTPTPTTY